MRNISILWIAKVICNLRYLNESSVLHTLRQRYVNNLIQTYAGPSIIAINPCKNLDIYSEKIRQMFKVGKKYFESLIENIYNPPSGMQSGRLASAHLFGGSGSLQEDDGDKEGPIGCLHWKIRKWEDNKLQTRPDLSGQCSRLRQQCSQFGEVKIWRVISDGNIN